MDIDFATILIFSGIFLVVFTIAELAYHLLKVEVGYTRKFVHVMTGIITMFFPIYFKKPADLIIICVSFFAILTLSKRMNLLPSINAIKRKSSGSILYPVVVIICYMVQWFLGRYVYFFVPILILALADPAAEFVGKKLQWRPYFILSHKKTLGGSLGFLMIAVLTAVLGLHYIGGVTGFVLVCSAIFTGIVTTIGEAVGIRGFDNLFIPLSAIATLYICGI